MQLNLNIKGGINISRLTSLYPQAHKVALQFRTAMVKRAKGRLGNAKGGTNLAKSLKGTVSKVMNRNAGRFTGGSSMPSITWEMNKYGAYVDEGVKGTFRNRAPQSPYFFTGRFNAVNVRSISDWLASVGKSRKLSYVIARSIYRKGIIPTHFWKKAYQELYPVYMKKYHHAIANDIATNIANQITKQLQNVQANKN